MSERVRLYFTIDPKLTDKTEVLDYFQRDLRALLLAGGKPPEYVRGFPGIFFVLSTYPQHAPLLIDALNSLEGVDYYATESENA